MSDNGASYISSDLGGWLKKRAITHIRGAPFHSQTQGKIERWHQTLKNRILLDHGYRPGDLEVRIETFFTHYNYNRFHENLNNLTPADVYYGRGDAILEERRRIKRETIANRPLAAPAAGRLNLNPQEPENLPIRKRRLVVNRLTTDRVEKRPIASTWT